MGPADCLVSWAPGNLSPGIKRPGLEADHFPPSNVYVKSDWIYLPHFPIRLHGVYRESFAFTFSFKFGM